MPKDTSSHGSGSRRDKNYTYKPYPSHGKGLEMTEGSISGNLAKDWDDATCPICIDFPHNAVLLLCSSFEKGCRPFICDTSHRHSNCLDQYQKAHFGGQKLCNLREQASRNTSFDTRSEAIGSESTRIARRPGRSVPVQAANRAEEFGEVQVCELEPFTVEDGEMKDPVISEHSRGSSSLVQGHLRGLVCPLCRGQVNGWEVVDEARQYLNRKTRSCAQESCMFVGNYEELRIHARREHPFARPAAIDPVREQDWRRMERQRDLGDVFSTIRSAMPGATVIGDFAIEDDVDNDDMDFPGDDGHWWTVFMLFQFFGSANSFPRGRGSSSQRRFSSHSRANSHGPRRNGRARLGLWGESWHRSGANASSHASEGSASGDQASESSQQQQRSLRVPPDHMS